MQEECFEVLFALTNMVHVCLQGLTVRGWPGELPLWRFEGILRAPLGGWEGLTNKGQESLED
ncbi:MAG: hypothetical protein FRX49_08582 [Trebouxia sp. A1-2]|nr:MAG: hypothetical protein FRX49_08582 [Trebouxia sp. A1-2]